jgi:hypothetical protein
MREGLELLKVVNGFRRPGAGVESVAVSVCERAARLTRTAEGDHDHA